PRHRPVEGVGDLVIPAKGAQAPAEPGSIGRRIVRNGLVLVRARSGTRSADPESGRAAQWVPDSLRFAAASGMTGGALCHHAGKNEGRSGLFFHHDLRFTPCESPDGHAPRGLAPPAGGVGFSVFRSNRANERPYRLTGRPFRRPDFI